MIIAGHTPTIIKGAFAYNRGNVFRYYDDAMDCIFYDIDCGCVFQNQISDAKLACIRLEDEKIFYAYWFLSKKVFEYYQIDGCLYNLSNSNSSAMPIHKLSVCTIWQFI